MKIGTRLFIIFLVISLIPLGVVGWQAALTIRDANALATSQSEAALTELGEQSIHAQALSVAHQIELYLHAHPELDLHDDERLESDTALAGIAVQPVGETGYTAIFDEKGITHFHSNPAVVGMDMSTLAEKLPDFWAIFSASMDGTPFNGYYDWEEADGQIRTKYMSVVPVGDTRLRVAATTYIDEFSQPMVATVSQLDAIGRDALQRLLIFMVVVAVLVGVLASFFSRQFALPVQQIADMATRVAGGERIVLKPSTRRDEIGELHRAFGVMITQLQQTLEGLERQVAERTHDLARRSAELEASAQVAREAAAIRDVKQLLDATVRLISEQFGFYHAGIFLLDEAKTYAILAAASSEGGQRMLARGHRLEVGQVGIVGYVSAQGEPRVALDVGQDAYFFNNPDLPGTRSEAGLPLQVHGQVIGVLDVQSEREAAFTTANVAILQTLADQLALAIDNARLLEEGRQTLQELQTLYGQQTRSAWQERLGGKPVGYFLSGGQVTSLEQEPPLPAGALQASTKQAGLQAEGRRIVAPVSLRGQNVGSLVFWREEEQEPWSSEDVEALEFLSVQVGLALENARLLEDSQRRVKREQLVGEVTTRIRAPMDMDTILQTAVRELGQAMGAGRVSFYLAPEERAD